MNINTVIATEKVKCDCGKNRNNLKLLEHITQTCGVIQLITVEIHNDTGSEDYFCVCPRKTNH